MAQNRRQFVTGTAWMAAFAAAGGGFGGRPVEIPDFTCGAWTMARPQAIGDIGLGKRVLGASVGRAVQS